MHGLYLTTILMQILLLIPDLLLRPDTSILRIHILVCGLVIYVDKFIWPCGLASCLSAVLSQGSNCQYPDSMFPRTISPPGCLLRFLEHSCFSLHLPSPWENCQFMTLSFCLCLSPWSLDLTSPPGPVVTGRTSPVQIHLLARAPSCLVHNI